MKPANFAPIYVTLYPPLADIAREHGYSLAVHGSVASDFDLIAIPWVETPKPADELVAAFARRLALLEGAFGTSMDTEPELKPHGRRAWNLYIGGMAKLDLSVMPTRTEATVTDNMQDWKGMDGTTAWHLIDRHADNWADIGKMMGEWLAANQNAAIPAPLEAPAIERSHPAPESVTVAWDTFCAGYDLLGNEWQDMGSDEYFKAGWNARGELSNPNK
jgi:hypothetical protein